MQKSWPIPDHEEARQQALDSYALLETEADESLDRITRLASQMLGVPIALISLVDRDRQWFLSRVGLEVPQTGREVAFCAHAICDQGILEVNDAQADVRFRDNPLVTDDPHIRFYAGVPLRNRDGFNLGTLCVVDRRPRHLSEQERHLLQELAGMVMNQLEQRRTTYLCPVTGLVNRRPFFESGQREFHRSLRQESPLAVLLFDLDDCRGLQERLGGRGGDQVLRGLGECMGSLLRKSDLLARVAEDEFAVLLLDTDGGGARRVAETIREAVMQQGVEIEGLSLAITVSCGVAVREASDRDFSDLFGRAAEALAQAKRAGRNCSVVAPPSPSPAAG